LIDIAFVNQLEPYFKLRWFASYIFSLYDKEVQNSGNEIEEDKQNNP